MNRRYLNLTACLLLLTFATGSSVESSFGGANGNPDMSGTWEGKKKYVDTSLETGGPVNLKGTCDLVMNLTQTGSNLSGTFELECPGFKSELFQITAGRVGNNHFWFESTGAPALGGKGTYLLAEGEVKSNRSLKGTGIILYGPDYVTRMTFSAKRPRAR
jgi:hypothetical protein